MNDHEDDDSHDMRAQLSFGHVERQMRADGYRDGQSAGEEASLQRGFDLGHRCGVLDGLRYGQLMASLQHADWSVVSRSTVPASAVEELALLIESQKKALKTRLEAVRRKQPTQLNPPSNSSPKSSSSSSSSASSSSLSSMLVTDTDDANPSSTEESTEAVFEFLEQQLVAVRQQAAQQLNTMAAATGSRLSDNQKSIKF